MHPHPQTWCGRGRQPISDDLVTGTFTARDPLDGVNGTPVVANPYHYADNDPLNKTDPLGLRPCDKNLDTLKDFTNNYDGDRDGLNATVNFLGANSNTCLMSLSTAENGRATLAIGDPAKAANVVIVPAAAGQSLQSFPTVSFANTIRNEAGPSVAAIAYLGYDTPKNHWSAPFQKLADNESSALADLINTYTNKGKHVTVVGYSYGAQATSQAFTDGGARADDVVLLGPFISTGSSWSGAKNIWAGTNLNDPFTTGRGTGKRWISTYGSSGAHAYDSGDALESTAAIAKGDYQGVICDAAQPDCRHGLI